MRQQTTSSPRRPSTASPEELPSPSDPPVFQIEDYGGLPIKTAWDGTFFVLEDGASANLTIGQHRGQYTRKGVEYLILHLRMHQQDTDLLEQVHRQLVHFNRLLAVHSRGVRR